MSSTPGGSSSLRIASHVSIPITEIQLSAIRAQGAGGQNVNKVATAIHLRFDIQASSLPDSYKERLLALKDRRISKEGVIIIKAQRYRSQEKNRGEALSRLKSLIEHAGRSRKKRVPTRPSKTAKKKRVDTKTRRGKIKALRGKIREEH